MRIPYKAILRDIKRVSAFDSQPVYFKSSSKQGCPDCEYDPFSGRSANSFCLTCDGEGFILSEESIKIMGQVEHVTGVESEWERGGKLKQGQVILTIHVDDILGADLSPSDILSSLSLRQVNKSDSSPTRHFVVSGKEHEILSVWPGELSGEIYELIFILDLPKI